MPKAAVAVVVVVPQERWRQWAAAMLYIFQVSSRFSFLRWHLIKKVSLFGVPPATIVAWKTPQVA
jgi:hypothetical protein